MSTTCIAREIKERQGSREAVEYARGSKVNVADEVGVVARGNQAYQAHADPQASWVKSACQDIRSVVHLKLLINFNTRIMNME